MQVDGVGEGGVGGAGVVDDALLRAQKEGGAGGEGAREGVLGGDGGEGGTADVVHTPPPLSLGEDGDGGGTAVVMHTPPPAPLLLKKRFKKRTGTTRERTGCLTCRQR